MHDRVAELAGLRVELAVCENGPRESRRKKTDEVQEQIDRVRGELSAEAEGLEERARVLGESGQDVPAAEAAVEARRIRASLGEDAPEPAETRRRAGSGGKRNAVAPKAPENTEGGGS
ncbi:hypothetical protein CG740_37215 [Streptomyces sp. CB01201]|uniref:hypothetical protein n=1 Tax=Streptomyces sp. CB01201 TaxID=2020324 RepID=UPI000C271C15|nr:hypothetical protein [Streptomyces sp. CB01201]PJM98126.1 hypothetical protein CG740_37215 [Streptomyces sp. CB01201]